MSKFTRKILKAILVSKIITFNLPLQKPNNQTDTTARVSQYLQMQRFLASATLCKLITPSVNMILGSEILYLHPKQFQAQRKGLKFDKYLQNCYNLQKKSIKKIAFFYKKSGWDKSQSSQYVPLGLFDDIERRKHPAALV